MHTGRESIGEVFFLGLWTFNQTMPIEIDQPLSAIPHFTIHSDLFSSEKDPNFTKARNNCAMWIRFLLQREGKYKIDTLVLSFLDSSSPILAEKWKKS